MKKTNPYIKLDTLLANAITSGIREFHELITNAGIKAESDRLVAEENVKKGLPPEHSIGATPGWRIVDRRLQALRKAEKIRYKRNTGWVAVDQNGAARESA